MRTRHHRDHVHPLDGKERVTGKRVRILGTNEMFGLCENYKGGNAVRK
jgi:hypothetical protein